jgi:hypothetical protein
MHTPQEPLATAPGWAIGLISFGAACLIKGHLMARSGCFPWLLSVMIQIAAVCCCVNSLSLFLASSWAKGLLPATLMPDWVAQLALSLWLNVKEVNLTRWPGPGGLGDRHRICSNRGYEAAVRGVSGWPPCSP